MPRFINVIAFILVVLLLTSSAYANLNLDHLSPHDIQHVNGVLEKLAPIIQARSAQENLATLSFQELYAPLDSKDQKFLKQFEHLDSKKLGVKIPFHEFSTGKEPLVVIKGQMIRDQSGKLQEWPPQYLPPHVYQHYQAMMAAMQRDIGKRLYVESGFRSSAYQLFTFVSYLKKHNYSIRETAKVVALPGFSEHGAPKFQAIDFMDQNGVTGELNPKDFEALPQYTWLLKNAVRFGFTLSYPKNSPVGINYEPWHWHYESLVPIMS